MTIASIQPEGGYDYVIGTSENGDCSLDNPAYALPKFKVSVGEIPAKFHIFC